MALNAFDYLNPSTIKNVLHMIQKYLNENIAFLAFFPKLPTNIYKDNVNNIYFSPKIWKFKMSILTWLIMYGLM